MASLRIPLSRITAAGLSVDVSPDVQALKPADAEALDALRVRVRGTLTPAVGQALFQGRITGAYRGNCDRCLQTVELPFDFEVLWAFATEPMADEGDTDEDDVDDGQIVVVAGDEIDLGPLVWEEMVLGLPSRFIPNPDDAGQCVECGADLTEPLVWRQENDVDSDQTSNKGLAGLGDLFPGLKPKDSEE